MTGPQAAPDRFTTARRAVRRAGPLLNQQTFYTALSRARYAIDLYTNDPDKLAATLISAPSGKTSALEGIGRLATGREAAGPGAPLLVLPPSSPAMKGRGGGTDIAIALPNSAAAAAADGARLMRAIERRNETERRNGEPGRSALAARLHDLLKRGRKDEGVTREERAECKPAANAGRAAAKDRGASPAERAKARDAEIQKETTREADRGGREISR